MKSVVLAAAAFAATVSGSASAQTYDAFESFNGTQGAGQFFYGEADPANPQNSGVFFQNSSNSNCFIAGSVCLQKQPNGTNVSSLPGVAKGGSPEFQYGTVNVPTDRLLAHPGNNALQTFVFFLAPSAGAYKVFATFNTQDINPSGVGINLIRPTNGGLPLVFTPLGTVGPGDTTFAYSAIFNLTASDAVGFGFDNQGNFSNDSTGFNFRVAAVPEPATWALMIMGFGLIGGAMRRKPRATLATA